MADPATWSFYQKKPHDLRPVYQDLRKACDCLQISCHVLTQDDQPVDIWIRDWGFVEDCFFEYRPSYARNLYSPAAVAKARQALTKYSRRLFRSVPLVLDGGNLVHNGRVAILTEKVLRDNPHRSKAEIEKIILSMGFEQVVLIPVEPEDEVGHADGILRFLSPELLLVNDYNHPQCRSYRRQLFTRLKKSKLPVQIVPFAWAGADFEEYNRRDGLWSAVGVYINFVLTAKGIIYPVFEHELDERVASVLAELTTIPALPVFATPLARLGGVLNCIVLTV